MHYSACGINERYKTKIDLDNFINHGHPNYDYTTRCAT